MADPTRARRTAMRPPDVPPEDALPEHHPEQPNDAAAEITDQNRLRPRTEMREDAAPAVRDDLVPPNRRPGDPFVRDDVEQRPDELRDANARGLGEPEQQANVAPEEQQQYDEVVRNAWTLVYGQGPRGPALQATLKTIGAGDPVDGLALSTVTLMKRVIDSAAQNGVEIGGDVKLHAGAEVMADLAELARVAKIHEFTPEEIERAGYRAMDLFREAEGGHLDRTAAQRDMQALIEADRTGELDRVVPGLREHFADVVPPQQAQQRPGRAPPQMAQPGMAQPGMARGFGGRAA